nr:putative zinc finger, CCHC-type [Tanacetum cinerariifolium]
MFLEDPDTSDTHLSHVGNPVDSYWLQIRGRNLRDLRDGLEDQGLGFDVWRRSSRNHYRIDMVAMDGDPRTTIGISYNPKIGKKPTTVKVRNGVDLNVEAVGTISLILEGGFCLNLHGTLYVPSMTRNLISVSKLIIEDFIFTF